MVFWIKILYLHYRHAFLIIAIFTKKTVPDFKNQVLCDVISSSERVPHAGSTTSFCYTAFMVAPERDKTSHRKEHAAQPSAPSSS